MRTVLIAVTLVWGLSSCLPASLSDETPDLAVVHAAGYDRPQDAAAALDDALRASDLDWDFVNAQTLRFLEVRRGSRASLWVQSAASVGRATSADTVVVVRPVVLERRLRDRMHPPASYVAELQLEVATVDAMRGEVTGSVLGPHLSAVGFLDDPEAGLPRVDEDHVLQRLAARAIDDMLPFVVKDLRELRRP